jgi:hypothetical protein
MHERSIGDLESRNVEEIVLSPMSDVHVRHEWKVTSTSRAESGYNENSCRNKSYE